MRAPRQNSNRGNTARRGRLHVRDPNVVITAHQAFLTAEALAAITDVTIANLDGLEAGRACTNAVT